MLQNKVPANRAPGYEIPENSQGNYHIKLLIRTWIPNEKRSVETEHVSIISPADYRNFKKDNMQSVLGYAEAVILHDPTYEKGKKQPEAETLQPEPVQPEAETPVKPENKGGRPKKK
jgi:hypothetical protein